MKGSHLRGRALWSGGPHSVSGGSGACGIFSSASGNLQESFQIVSIDRMNWLNGAERNLHAAHRLFQLDKSELISRVLARDLGPVMAECNPPVVFIVGVSLPATGNPPSNKLQSTLFLNIANKSTLTPVVNKLPAKPRKR